MFPSPSFRWFSWTLNSNSVHKVFSFQGAYALPLAECNDSLLKATAETSFRGHIDLLTTFLPLPLHSEQFKSTSGLHPSRIGYWRIVCSSASLLLFYPARHPVSRCSTANILLHSFPFPFKLGNHDCICWFDNEDWFDFFNLVIIPHFGFS